MTPCEILDKEVIVAGAEHDGVAGVELVIRAVDLGLMAFTI